jgi:hypothetical protein
MNSVGDIGGCITDALLHSSINDHHEHATEQRQLRKNDPAAWGAVRVTFCGAQGHGVS